MRPKKTQFGRGFDRVLGVFWQLYTVLGMALFLGLTLIIALLLVVMIPVQMFRPDLAGVVWMNVEAIIFVALDSTLLLHIQLALITGLLFLTGATGLSYVAGELREYYFRVKHRLGS